jgi:hypothetical protein
MNITSHPTIATAPVHSRMRESTHNPTSLPTASPTPPTAVESVKVSKSVDASERVIKDRHSAAAERRRKRVTGKLNDRTKSKISRLINPA